ncbi:MAG: efflux RND transporter periplasmic adaptor subunit [Burkholderiaceae bacterium]
MRLVYLAAAAAVLQLPACSKPVPPAEEVRPVRVITVTPSNASAVAELAGEVRPRIETRAGFQVAGRITQRLVDIGQTVKAGQWLAQIDPQDYRLAAEAAQAGLNAAQADRDQQRADYQRFQDLQAKGFISQADLDRRKAALNAAEARWSQANANRRTSGNQADYATLRAPHDAVVTGLDAETGQVVAAGQSVVRLARTGEKEVAVGIPEQQLALVKPGKEVEVRLWAGGAPLKARVREVSPAADPATRTYPARVSLTDASADVALGMTANVVISSPVQQALLLPLQAVLLEGGKPQVWLFDAASSTALRRPVKVGGVAGNEIVILEGIRAGDVVVTAGVHLLKDGQKVRLLGTTPGAAPAPGAAKGEGAKNG